MRYIIANNHTGILDRFGSMFFVLEAKGIKLLTKVLLETDGFQGPSPWDWMVQELPHLDFEYMLNRNNGELVADIGYSIHPLASEPMVGMWRLDALESSFGKGGYLAGKLHNANTLWRYGGLQAEMPEERANRTQVLFRSSYNLHYESTRAMNNKPFYAEDKDAYMANDVFQADTNRRTALYQGSAANMSYGVRDEYRVGGQALQILLSQSTEMVSKYAISCLRPLSSCLLSFTQMETYNKSKPILWIPSRLWFEFQARRVNELQRTQLHLVRRQPPNLGILTGVICNLLRRTDSTPQIEPLHVRESLALLRFREVQCRFGMFFLHDLDPQSDVPLEDHVQVKDTTDILQSIGVGIRKVKKKALPISEGPSAVFPIGSHPTWKTLQAYIKDHPHTLLGEWVYDLLTPVTDTASRLFISFTRQLWCLLNEGWKQTLSYDAPATLEDAMAFWTVQSLHSCITTPLFKACNAGLKGGGARGAPQLSFRKRALQMYFTPPDVVCHHGSQWKNFANGFGYLKTFHDTLEKMSDTEQTELQHNLEDIFELLQCLPDSTIGSPAVSGAVWRRKSHCILIITNPKHYRIEGIGAASRIRQVKRPHAVPPTNPRSVCQQNILIAEGYVVKAVRRIQTERRKATRLVNRHRTGKAKNKRAPPTKRQRSIQSGSTLQVQPQAAGNTKARLGKGSENRNTKRKNHKNDTSSDTNAEEHDRSTDNDDEAEEDEEAGEIDEADENDEAEEDDNAEEDDKEDEDEDKEEDEDDADNEDNSDDEGESGSDDDDKKAGNNNKYIAAHGEDSEASWNNMSDDTSSPADSKYSNGTDSGSSYSSISGNL